MDKQQVIEELKSLLGKRMGRELRKRSGYSRPSVSEWINKPERRSRILLKTATELIEEEKAAEEARLAVRRQRLRVTA